MRLNSPIAHRSLTMRNPSNSDAFDAFAEDLMMERSMRPLVIVGASKVEHLLYEILNSYLLPKHAKAHDQDELLEGDRPLSTFSARIKLCRRLGLIDESLYVILEQLRVLRNLSAHSIAFDVAKSPVREHFTEVKKQLVGRQSFQLTKERYFDSAPFKPTDELQCMLLTLCVLLEAIREKTRTTKGNKGALEIATR
jgi:hypothetical protein